MLNLKQAAEALGYSESGLRKLVTRGGISFLQARPHAPLRFRPEWLEAFIQRNAKICRADAEAAEAEAAEAAPARPKRLAVAENRYGL